MAVIGRFVLLVEDNPIDAELMGRVLRKFRAPSVELSVATSLSECHASIAARTPDVVLLGLGLPDSYGFATLASVRERWPELRVVVVSGMMDEDFATQASDHGATRVLRKGRYDVESLAEALFWGG